MSMVKPLGQQAGTAQRAAGRWLSHLAFVAAIVVFLGLYANTFESLVSIWASTGRYQYAFLIFPVSAALVWMRRGDLKRLAATPALLGLATLAILCLIWLVGAAAHINVATHFSIIAMVPCLVFTFYGTAITRTLMFPLAYLVFAIPFGNFLVGPLQDITARLSVAALQWTPVPVFVNGHYIMTPAGTWHVAEACSGVSFFFATTAFGTLYAYLFFRSWRRRLLFVALALVAPIIANGLRVFFTILIGEYFGMHYATGTDHMIFGWQFFGTVLILLFLVGWPWHEAEAPRASRQPRIQTRHRGVSHFRILALLVTTLATLAIAPVWIAATAARSAPTFTPPALSLPETLGGLSQTAVSNVGAGPGTVFRRADYHARVRYGSGQALVLVNVAIYAGVANEDNELVSIGNRIFDPTVWVTLGKPANVSDFVPVGFRSLYLASRTGNRRWLVWYAYRSAGRMSASPATIKLRRVWNRLLGRAPAAGVVVLASPVMDGNARRTATRMARVAKDLLPSLRQLPDRKQ